VAGAWRCLVAVVALAQALTGSSAEDRVMLPTRADLKIVNPVPLVGKFPNRIPLREGTISESEVVRVGLRPNGAVHSIVVDQRIELGGVGDYTLEITGPATDVEGLAGSDARPGLRSGSVIWEGFSPGTRLLRARIRMNTSIVRFRSLPVSVERTEHGVRFTNATAQAQALTTGDVEPAELTAAGTAIRSALERGVVPAPGTEGIPVSLAGRGELDTEAVVITIPMHLEGDIGSVHVDAVLADEPLELAVPATAKVSFSATPVLPHPGALGAGSLIDVQRVLWQVARATGEGFLGVPVDAPVDARYLYEPAVITRAVPTPTPGDQGARPIPIVLTAIVLVLLLVLGARWWAKH
jgi:hypothetical protein